MTMRLLILATLLACAASHVAAQLGLPTPGEVAAPSEPNEPHAAERGTAPAAEATEASPAEPSPAAPPAPTATPSPAPIGPTAPVAISTGTSTGISALAQGPGEAEPEEEEEKPWLPWMGAFSWSQGYTAAGVSQSAYQTFNPTYAWAFLLTAGYNFSKYTALTLNQYAVVELTDSDTTARRQQLLFYDTSADLSHKLEYVLDSSQKLALIGAAGLVFPTSKASQAATVILGTRARVGATYSQKHVLEGLDVGPSFSYWRRWNSSNTPQADGHLPCTLAGGGSQDCLYLASASTSRDLFLLGIDSSLQITDKLSAGLSLTFWWVLARSLGTFEETMPLTGPVTVGDTSTTHWRNTRWLLLSLGYKVTDWFTTTARITNIFAERGMAGQLRSPFNPIDTVLGLELAVSFDQLYLSSQGHGETKR